MLLLGTKKLLQFVNVAAVQKEPMPTESLPPLYRWHADVATVDRLKSVVLVNEETFFTIVFYGLEDSDLERFDVIMADGIRDVFRDLCINKTVIDAYLSQHVPFVYNKTTSNPHIAHLSVILDDIKHNADAIQTETHVQSILSKRLNKYPIQTDQGLIVPKVAMWQALERKFGVAIFKTKAIELGVNVECSQRILKRTFIVPLRYTFRELHETLQIAFNWPNTHPHRFEVRDETGHPILTIGPIETSSEQTFDSIFRSEETTYLESVLTQHPVIYYTYGIGQGLVHHIDVLRTVLDYQQQTPLCLEGTGTLHVSMTDDGEESSDRKDMVKMEYEEAFLPEEVNHRLSRYFGA